MTSEDDRRCSLAFDLRSSEQYRVDVNILFDDFDDRRHTQLDDLDESGVDEGYDTVCRLKVVLVLYIYLNLIDEHDLQCQMNDLGYLDLQIQTYIDLKAYLDRIDPISIEDEGLGRLHLNGIVGKFDFDVLETDVWGLK